MYVQSLGDATNLSLDQVWLQNSTTGLRVSTTGAVTN